MVRSLLLHDVFYSFTHTTIFSFHNVVVSFISFFQERQHGEAGNVYSKFAI